jgi:hypothetical protein
MGIYDAAVLLAVLQGVHEGEYVAAALTLLVGAVFAVLLKSVASGYDKQG